MSLEACSFCLLIDICLMTFFFRIGAVALELAQKVSVTLCLVTNTARKTHKDEPRQKLEASKSSVAMFA